MSEKDLEQEIEDLECEVEELENENEDLRKALKECYLDEKSASLCKIFFLVLLGIFLGYAWNFAQCHTRLINLENQYKEFYFNVLDSPEYKAIQKCSTEDYFRAECIAFELNKRKGEN